jgi:DNA invertase Pin-like site-specific DNA recombinase
MRPSILAFLSALADDERDRIVKRAAEGSKTARTKGVIMGLPPDLTKHQADAKGESCRSIAKSFNCHHSTISRCQK